MTRAAVAPERETATRVLALWCPDWPAIAAATEADLAPDRPVAVLAAGRVVACSAPARSAGVRRGLRRREAQARCPELHVAADDGARDARVFEPIAAAVAELVPLIEVVRPGLVVMSARGAARYFGGEEEAAERLVDAVSAVGAESQVGAADEVFTAASAARRGVLVPPGESASFLAPLPIMELAAEPALCSGDGDRAELLDLLRRLGLRTVGAFAGLSATDVATRFGLDAIAAHRQARAVADRPPSTRALPPGLEVELCPDPPIDRVDAAAFAGRALAAELHAGLASAGVACLRLQVDAVTANGERHTRVWRCAEPLTPEGTADRIRWQLDGWLTGGRGSGAGPSAPVVLLRLEPVEVADAGATAVGIWGGDGDGDARFRRALVRVQGLLGGEAVRVGVRSGGRGPAEQVTWVPLGDALIPERDPSAPWPGRLPEPAPTVLVTGARVEVADARGEPVRVTERGVFTTEPTHLAWGSRGWALGWWAGPWLIDERWWERRGQGGSDPSSAGAEARAQVRLEEEGGGRALLLHYVAGGWEVEGIYE
ncbi:DNA polymerase Y family protein [Tsukamurella sp. 8F]|uniref:DNA polymerase Y family protein n=1 Tax=unclassified Tsukamurella TaxID=2633480 RepID=UPI0023B9FD7D|nr:MULTISPECIES: DNA polymerase Y family protein [unclassified Tsukamurella]MDF0532484.1 DNA polymerase Y family protein [Tsukamurella sp. 8J]MDF0589315.1 DNA polymerase Y family protein [Tsukamurella sp. 8F]